MSVFAEKGPRSAPLAAFEKRVSPEKLRLQGEQKSEERPLEGGGVDAATRLASIVATAVPLSSAFPLWFYIAAVAMLILGTWGAAGIWVAATDPPKRVPLDGGKTAVMRQEGTHNASSQPPAATSSASPTAQDSHMTPPARLGDGVADMAATPTVMQMAPLTPTQPASPTITADVPSAPHDAVPAGESLAPAAAAEPPPGLARETPVIESGVAETTTASPTAQAPSTQLPSRQAKCLVKVSGRVLFERACPVQSVKASSFTLDLGGGRSLVVSLDHGETWTATLAGKNLGKVYRDGQCWGRRKEVYICALGV